MCRRVIAALTGALLFASLVISPAHAQDDCDDESDDTNVITLDPPNPGPGDEVTLASPGFEPGVTVDISLEPSTGPPLGTSMIGDFETPEAGMLNATVTLPDDLAPGMWTIRVVSQKCSADEGSVDFTIPGAAADTGGTQNADVLGTGTGVSPAAATDVLPVAQVKAAAQTGPLASTGSNRILSLAGLAVGLLGGGVAVMAGRRRARHSSGSA